MELMTVDEVAEILKVNPKTIATWLREGKMPGIKLGDGKRAEWRIEKEQFNKFIESRKSGY